MGESIPKSSITVLATCTRISDSTQAKKIAGVAEVDTNGGYSTEVHINYIPKKIFQHGLNIEEIIQAIKDVGSSFGGSYIKKDGEQITIRSLVPLESLDDIRQIPIKILPSGKQIRVEDVCTVKFESAPRLGGATYQGKETVLGTILMRVGANSSKVIDQVKESIKTLNLPDDVSLEVVYNRQYLVGQTVQTVIKNLAEGAVLVIVILMMILGNFRASLIVASAIPFSMLVALKGMHLFDISANLMSLGAIDFGLLVDASVVLTENYLRRLEKHETPLNPIQRYQILIQSSAEVAKPVIFGLSIIMLVYIPILALEGVEGKMFEPMALTVLMALAASLMTALFVVPILLFTSLKNKPSSHESFIFRWIQKGYQPILAGALKFRTLAITVPFVLFGAALIFFMNLGADFVPELEEGDLVIGLVRDSKQDIDKSIEEQIKAEKIIQEFEEVSHVFSRIGTPESATDPMSPNFADTFVILKKDKAQWPLVNGKRRSKQELFEAMSLQLKERMEAQDISATQPIEMRFNEILEGSRADITLRFLGPDLSQLVKYAKAGEEILKSLHGVQSVEFDALTGLTQSKVLDVEILPEQAVAYGLTPSDINQYVETSLAGQEVGTFFVNGIKTPFVFHLDEGIRNNIDLLKQLPIPVDKAGGDVKLGDLAEFRMSEKVTTIARRWAERYSAVSVYLSGRDMASFIEEARKKIAQSVPLEQGYSTEWGGQFKNLNRARTRLLILIPVTLIGIFVLIFLMTQSWLQSAIIFVSIPMGITGGVFLLVLRQMNFSVSAAIGFIALSGIVVLNSLVLVNSINELHSKGWAAPKAIRQGALLRLRPVVMTALVAGLGFLPMAFNTGMGAEVQRPLATVVIGGLLTSTVLTMIVIPVLLTFVMNSSVTRVETD
jgi:cobalt-zinc-cadmium resistance protein CzcA